MLFAALFLSACGSGDNAATAKTTAKGVISGFGSLHVNGIQYATDGATVTMDGMPATVHDLKVGMVVTVTGKVNDDHTAGSATRIDFSDLLQGPVSAIDPAAGTITIYGQTIRVDNDTFFTHFSGLAALNAGDIVEVSGIVDCFGVIWATHLGKKAPDAELEIKGEIVGHVGATTFSLEVAPNAPPVTVIFPTYHELTIAEGASVKVTTTRAGIAGPIVIATGVTPWADAPLASGDKLEMGGYVTHFSGADNFRINGIAVNAAGLAAARTLQVGTRVEVAGTMSNGLLLASAIEKGEKSDVALEGEVFSVAPGTLTFSLRGRRVIVNERTAFRDDSSSHDRNFNLEGVSGIKMGDYVEIAGHLDGDSFLASKVVRKDGSA
jgi:hypothetical protein